jgi:1-acyl-sn-glycerol-3-phosphate acyltransferase
MVEPIAIDRGAGRAAVRQILERGTEALGAGRWVVIFPEGTRVAPGERRKYGIGGALLAERSGFPVYPVAHNAGVFWRRRDLRKLPGTVQVIVGSGIDTRGKKASAINREVEAWIEGQMERLDTRPAAVANGDGARC